MTVEPMMLSSLMQKLDEIQKGQGEQAVALERIQGAVNVLNERVSNSLEVQGKHDRDIRELKEGKADVEVAYRVSDLEKKMYKLGGIWIGISTLLSTVAISLSVWKVFQ